MPTCELRCTHAHIPAGFELPLWILCQFFSHFRSLLAQLCSPCWPIRFFRLRGRYLSTHNKLLPSSCATEGVLFPAPNSRVFLTSDEGPWRAAPGVEDGGDFPGEGLLLLVEGFWGETLRPGGVLLLLELWVLDLVALFWNVERWKALTDTWSHVLQQGATISVIQT